MICQNKYTYIICKEIPMVKLLTSPPPTKGQLPKYLDLNILYFTCIDKKQGYNLFEFMNFNQNCTSNILFLNSWVLMISLKKKKKKKIYCHSFLSEHSFLRTLTFPI